MYFSLPPENPARAAENQDQLAVLREAGFGPLLDALADTDIWTKGAGCNRPRPKFSSIARRLGINTIEVQAMFRRAREFLDHVNDTKKST
jgi:hypothetical protein